MAEPTPTPTPAAQTADPSRDTVLAELAAGAHRATAKPAEQRPVEAAAEPAVEAQAAPAEDAEDEADDAEPAAETKPEPAPQKLDPDVERRLSSIQKAEKQAAETKRQALEAQQQLAQQQAAWKTEQKAAADEVKQAREILAGLKRDPAGTYERLGVPLDRFEEIARAFAARSPKYAEKPEYREASERALREREGRDELSSLREQVTSLQRAQEEKFTRMDAERQAERHMAGVFEAARGTTEAPLLAQAFAKNAKKTEARLAQIALDLTEQNGELPDSDDVIAEFTKRRTGEIEDLGFTVDEYLRQQSQAKTTTKTQDKAAGEKRPARTLLNDNAASTPVRPKVDLSPEEEREQLLGEMARLRASGGLESALG